MEDSPYDNFRWFDEDADIDLTLCNYHQQATSRPPSIPHRRRPSFRRTLSFNSVNLSRRSTSLASYGKASIASPPADSQSVLSNITSRRSSLSRPASKNKPHHTSQTSTSSIDPSAQYYHDPEARLKLRVFLASPQKFDEAIQFGFPAPSENETTASETVQSHPKLQVQEFKGTFLDDDNDHDGDGDGGGLTYRNRKDQASRTSRLSYITENPQLLHDLGGADRKRQSWMPSSEAISKRTPSTREMTLRMTLTRPDLRADGCLTPTTTTEAAQIQPQLLRAHEDADSWEQDTEEQNLMRKMWRKFRRRKG
ncbi:hypothetical protein BDV06DRAFT_188468 [Aspergillus oleicola]